MIGAVPAARVVHSSLQDIAFVENEEWHHAGIEFRSVDDHGRLQTIPDLHINVTAAIAR